MCHPEVPAGQVTPEVAREEVQIPVANGEKMPGLLARPEGGEGAGVLIINDIMGRSPFYEDLAARLATAGFVALCPEFFFRQGPLEEQSFPAAFARRAKLDEKNAVRDLSAAIDWLKQQPGVRGGKAGTIGFCMGGTLILNLAAARKDLVSVCFYGFPAGAGAEAKPTSPTAPLDQVDQINGPLLAFWGDQDTMVGQDNVEKLAQGLQQRGVDFAYKVYPGLGHGFMAQSRLDPDHAAYEAACEAWTRTLEFYRQHLGALAGAR